MNRLQIEKETSYQFPVERTDGRQAFPEPEQGECVCENPPTFVWLQLPCDHTDDVVYRCSVTDASGATVYECETTGNLAVPDRMFPPGEYKWDVEALSYGVTRGKQTFTVPENAIPFLRPTAEEVSQGIPACRPRHLFTAAELPGILERHGAEVETLRRNIKQAYQDGLPKRPMFHVEDSALPYREYFGRFRDFCDRNLVACALGYALLGDEEAGHFAKKLFLHICDWNPSGPCSLNGPWGDEVGLSCARCFPAVYDMLYPLLSEKERMYAGETVATYALQCEKRIARINYVRNPGDSHVGRLPAYLGEAALVLWGESIVSEETLRRWLETALRVYGGNFPHYGSKDGSWAEGTFYSTSYTKWYLPFFSAVARYSGKSFLNRPFYRNFAKYLVHFALPDHEIHPFGDGYWCTPESPEWPGFFAQNPFRTYAQVSGIPEACAYEKQLAAPELFSLHLLDVFLPEQRLEVGAAVLPDGKVEVGNVNQSGTIPKVTDADVFPGGGYISLHSDHTDPGNDLHVIVRASKYGPGSHRQPDQGSFALFLGGTALLTPSGYFGRAYGTKHHMGWYNSTKAHNAILIDGVGQDYHNFRHTGKILFGGFENADGTDQEKLYDGAEERENFIRRKAVLDLSASYPMLESWIRTIRMTDARTLLIEDVIKAEKPVTVTWPLHMLSQPVERGNAVIVEREGKKAVITPADHCFVSCHLTDAYDIDLNEGEPEAYHVSMPKQYHVYFETEAKTEHKICVEINVLNSEII